jgi:hypothetical protein
LRRAQPAAPAQTDGPATGKVQGAVCLNRGCGRRDSLSDARKPQ